MSRPRLAPWDAHHEHVVRRRQPWVVDAAVPRTVPRTDPPAGEHQDQQHGHAEVARQRAQRSVEVGRPSPRPADRDEPTARELDVLRLIAGGHGNDGAAAELGVSHETIKAHLRNLYRGIGAANAPHAVHIAHERGWL